jgi:hypothetical protein
MRFFLNDAVDIVVAVPAQRFQVRLVVVVSVLVDVVDCQVLRCVACFAVRFAIFEDEFV